MKNGNKFITVGGAAGGPMILHWMTKNIRHMFSTTTRALPKYPLPKVIQISHIIQQMKSWLRQ